jgi:hypothetical protein
MKRIIARGLIGVALGVCFLAAATLYAAETTRMVTDMAGVKVILAGKGK